MQALFIIALFTFVITLMTSIMTSGSSNSAQLTDDRIAEVGRFFEAVAKVVKNDITQQYLHANPNGDTDPADYIRNIPVLAAMSSGLYGDAGVDAWGKDLQGGIVTEYLLVSASSDSENVVRIPVTAVAFVSGGPDGVIQTTIPSNPTTILQVRNILVPTNAQGVPQNDDIVYTFDNREDQMRQLQNLRTRMEHIGTAALKEYQYNVTQFRAQKVAEYQTAIQAGQAATPPDMELTSYSNAPKMISLNTAANRYKLGVDEDFKILERTLASGGKMRVTAASPATASAPLMITLQNDATNPTPWGNPATSFQYVVRVYPDKI